MLLTGHSRSCICIPTNCEFRRILVPHTGQWKLICAYLPRSGWVPNTELIELDPETVLDVKMDKMRKTLQAAHHLAAESHPLSFYKEVLQNYQEELIEQEKAKAAKAATPKGKKSKAISEDDEDIDMEDAPAVEETPAKDKKAKKRKAEESAEVSRAARASIIHHRANQSLQTPQRSDSVKKPKIKLTTSATPKVANGATSTPKSTKAADSKSAKSKNKKKDADEAKVEKEASAPKEPELSPEDRRVRKQVRRLAHVTRITTSKRR